MLKFKFWRAWWVVALAIVSAPAQAQPRDGWGAQLEGLAIYQGDASLSGGGSFTASRVFLRASSIYRFQNGHSAGLSASVGQFDYTFSQAQNQPWTDIRDIRVSAPLRFRVGESGSLFLSPQARWDFQSGVNASDGATYGVFAGYAWKVNNRLTIGPAFGAYSQLEASETQFFPALLIDWDITDRWNLTTGPSIGATQGPGLTLGYALSDSLTLALSGRSENVRFRLDDVGLAPNGVGEDQSLPVVVSLSYNPNPGISVSAFAGAEFDGQLTLDDANGAEISRQSYETAPIAGLGLRLRF